MCPSATQNDGSISKGGGAPIECNVFMEWVVVPILLLSIAMLIFHYRRSGSILDKWAAENGYQILESELRPLRRGPFFFTTAKGQEVYRVTVQDAGGAIRRGYVRCGSFFFGMLSDRAEVRWDNEAPDRPGFPVVMPEGNDPGDKGGDAVA
jgi:hypothetical protein